MKKAFSLILLLCLVLYSISYADSILNLSLLSDEDLYQLRNDIDAEIVLRHGTSEQTNEQPVYNKDGIVIYKNGDIEKSITGAELSLLIENNTDKFITLCPIAFTVNGIQLGDFDAPYSLCEGLLPGNKTYSTSYFSIDKCGVKDEKEIKMIKFYCQVYGPYGEYQYNTDDIIIEFD